jgi:ABC-type phosphate transport system substrate-binding protein
VQAKSTEDLIEFIAKTPGAIGYMERSKVDGRVKMVFEP